MTLEQKLVVVLDRLTEGATLTGASRLVGHGDSFINYALKLSKDGKPECRIEWRGDTRPFHEHVLHAQNAGKVERIIRDRGVTIKGEQQYVIDLSLLERFGFDDDAKDLAELCGYPDFPYATGSDGKRIPLLSARHPRPQRSHRPPPKPAPEPLPMWSPEMGVPAYSRTVRAPAPPPKVPHIHNRETSPLVADLRAKLERGVTNPHPEGPLSLAHGYIGPAIQNDPKELVTGASDDRTA